MKKIFIYIAAIALAVSCTNDMADVYEVDGDGATSSETVRVTLNLSMEGEATSSRVSITPGESDSDDWVGEWEDGDVVCAYSIAQNAYTTLTYVAEGNEGGVFTGDVYPGENRIYYYRGETYLYTSSDESDNNYVLFYSGGTKPVMISDEIITVEVEDEDGDGVVEDTFDVYMMHVGAMIDFRMSFENILDIFDQAKISYIYIGGTPDGATDGEYASVPWTFYTYPDESVTSDDFINSELTSYGSCNGYITDPVSDDGESYSAYISVLPFTIEADQKLQVQIVFSNGYTLTDYIENTTGEDFTFARATHNYLEKTYDLSDLIDADSWLSQATPFTDTTSAGTEDDPIEIASEGELAYLAAIASGFVADTTTEGVYYKLTKDLNLSGYEWYPIGKSSSCRFFGHFDGGNCTISNLTMDASSAYSALFGFAGEGSSIENLTIKDPAMSSSYSLAAVCGLASYSAISNCTVEGGSVSSSSSYTASVVGFASYTQIIDCHNIGTKVSGKWNVGGVAASVSYSTISGCTNTGEVIASSSTGGVVGHSQGSDICACYNIGSISGSTLIGGVVGYINSNSFSSTITSCYNVGSVTGDSDVGAVLGYKYGAFVEESTLTQCYYLPATADLTDSYGGVSLSSVAELNAKVEEMNAAANTVLETTEVAYFTKGTADSTLPGLLGETITFDYTDPTED